MVPLLIIFAVSSVAGIVILIVSSKKSPEGYQSESGFHYSLKETNDSSRPVGQPVSGNRVGQEWTALLPDKESEATNSVCPCDSTSSTERFMRTPNRLVEPSQL